MKKYQLTTKDGKQRTLQTDNDVKTLWQENPDSKYIRLMIDPENPDSYYEVAKTIVSAVIRRGYRNGQSYLIDLSKADWTHPDKEDLLQTAALAIVENPENPDSYYAAAFKAVNAAIWQARKSKPAESDYLASITTVNRQIATESNGNGFGWSNIQALLSELTPRQRQIIKLKAQGLSVAQIAEKMGVKSKGTIGEHLQAIRKKAAKYNPYK